MSRSAALPVFTAIALSACYAPTLAGMAEQWQIDPDSSHGAAVPAVIAWVVWRERAQWMALPPSSSAWGWAILLAGASMHAAGALGGGLFASSVALLVSVSGAVVLLGGFALLRMWAFPFALSLFLLPKLAIVYNQATLPLQLAASRMAAALLTVGGFGVIRDGNILEIRGHRILVAEACNGIRYLLALAFAAAVLGYVSGIRPWARVAIVAATVPVALLANTFRVAASGAYPALAGGDLHDLTGMVVFAGSVGVLCAAAYAFQRVSGKAGV